MNGLKGRSIHLLTTAMFTWLEIRAEISSSIVASGVAVFAQLAELHGKASPGLVQVRWQMWLHAYFPPYRNKINPCTQKVNPSTGSRLNLFPWCILFFFVQEIFPGGAIQIYLLKGTALPCGLCHGDQSVTRSVFLALWCKHPFSSPPLSQLSPPDHKLFNHKGYKHWEDPVWLLQLWGGTDQWGEFWTRVGDLWFFTLVENRTSSGELCCVPVSSQLRISCMAKASCYYY